MEIKWSFMMYADALKDHFGENTFRYSIEDSVGYNSLKFISDVHQKPTLEEFNQILENYKNIVLPLKKLRIQRNRILQESDWRDLPSYPGTDQAEWRTYRQALRDLTNTETPALSDNGELINVNWPVPPGESNGS
jgi:hypothetical protein